MNTKQLEIRVTNLDCEHDADAIKRGLQGFPGIAELRVYPKSTKVAITYDPAVAKPDTVKVKLESLGWLMFGLLLTGLGLYGLRSIPLVGRESERDLHRRDVADLFCTKAEGFRAQLGHEGPERCGPRQHDLRDLLAPQVDALLAPRQPLEVREGHALMDATAERGREQPATPCAHVWPELFCGQ